MKTLKYLLLTTLGMVLSTACALANDDLQLSVSKGTLENTHNVSVDFENETSNNYTAFQMDIELPENVSVVENSLQMGLRISTHQGTIAKIDNDTWRLVVYSINNVEFAGNSGNLFTFTIQQSATISGNQEITLKNIVFAKRDGKEIEMDEVSEKLSDTPSQTGFTITYLVDGVEYNTQVVKEGETIPTIAAPTKEGHTFTGWKDIPSVMPDEDISVEAVFEVNTYKLYVNVNGEIIDVIEVKYGEKIPLPEEPDEEGFVFTGWSEVPETMPAHDLTIYGNSVATSIGSLTSDTVVTVYNLQGVKLVSGVSLEKAKRLLRKGVYIVNGQMLFIQ